ncbi:hypothetical protein I553_6954 [Mycobacterium xenopi 4042]|uniref:Mycothiol-dependent maleylpyruvate isomerase metal-binding domain-containing protein n=1 Tax=Mycobacterium xenopi 4042 TaxID=1299334 RepID=X7Z5E1_MYCXE|nr:hypothetical protein I553_6954 [Mycobacterium xenopi 4042]EUA33772.1 hypothetical protein I552_4551 [Mycobacterium xenopi 3993]
MTRPLTQLDKSDVLPGLYAAWDAIDRLLDGLPESAWEAPTPLPGWGVRAVVSHLIGTESMLMGVATPPPTSTSPAWHTSATTSVR